MKQVNDTQMLTKQSININIAIFERLFQNIFHISKIELWPMSNNFIPVLHIIMLPSRNIKVEEDRGQICMNEPIEYHNPK